MQDYVPIFNVKGLHQGLVLMYLIRSQLLLKALSFEQAVLQQ